MDEKHDPAVSTADRAEALVQRINQSARDIAKDGVKEAYALAGTAILVGQLVKALERIERLEGDIQLLTEMLASVEEKR